MLRDHFQTLRDTIAECTIRLLLSLRVRRSYLRIQHFVVTSLKYVNKKQVNLWLYHIELGSMPLFRSQARKKKGQITSCCYSSRHWVLYIVATKKTEQNKTCTQTEDRTRDLVRVRHAWYPATPSEHLNLKLQWKDHVIDHQSEPSSILIVLALRPALLKGDSTAKIVAGYSHIHCALSLIDWVPPASSSNTLASNLSPNHNSTPSRCVCVVFVLCFV